jgi:hypothetical protein
MAILDGGHKRSVYFERKELLGSVVVKQLFTML